MTTKQCIISFLQTHPQGIDDDELTKALNLSRRQQVNARCNELEKEGLVIRRRVNGKIHNFWAGKPTIAVPASTPKPSYDSPNSELWFWEGNVQSQVVNYLSSLNFQIRSVADTASRQQGIDIIAEKEGKQLWVSAKGFPKGTDKTHPSTEAGHWFKEAIFDIIEYRGQNKTVLLAIALPDYPRYHSLAEKISWLKPVANFIYFWVRENGEVVPEK
jgi:hypothetical protein